MIPKPSSWSPKALFKWRSLLCSLFSKIFFHPKWDAAVPDCQRALWALNLMELRVGVVLSVPAGQPQCLMAWRNTLLLSHSPRAGLHFQLSFLTASEAEQAEYCPGEVERFSVESSTLPPLTSFVFFYRFMSLLLAFYLAKHLGIAFLCVNNLV